VDNDSAVFAAMYPSLRRFAAVVGWGGDDPDDLVQHAVERALRHSLLSDLDDPERYLRTVIARLASNNRRNRFRRDKVNDRLAHSAAPDVGGSVDLLSESLAVLGVLSAQQRAIVYLHLIDGYSHVEIAALLGMSAPAVRTRYSRALQRLRIDVQRQGSPQ
jgi:RNA polymerase sigma factor (sigma-70 family)